MKWTPPPIGIILTPASVAVPSTRPFHPDGSVPPPATFLSGSAWLLRDERHRRDAGHREREHESLHRRSCSP